MPSDTELAANAKRGDVRAFELLVERYKERAYMIALGLVGNHADAMDLSQEAFVKAYRAMRTFKEGSRFYPWFYAILRNSCFNHLRRIGTRRETSLDAASESGTEFADRTPDPAAAAERKELRELIMRELQALAPPHREILLLRHFEELSYKEMSDVLGCPIGTVMSRLYAARKALGARLKQYVDGDTEDRAVRSRRGGGK